MSHYDGQPDSEPHGDCAIEIHRLETLNTKLLGALTYIHSVIAAQNNMGANWQTDSVMRRLLDVLAPIQKATK